jgi:hypothetical protein
VQTRLEDANELTVHDEQTDRRVRHLDGRGELHDGT